MQYSKDRIYWSFPNPVSGKTDMKSIARIIDAKPGDFIYFREHAGDIEQKMRYTG